METVSLVARVACVYDGRAIKRGQKFSATPEDARLLTLVKMVDEVKPSQVPEVSAELIESSDEPPKRKRARAELQAEP